MTPVTVFGEAEIVALRLRNPYGSLGPSRLRLSGQIS
jgi:hypothetical protein